MPFDREEVILEIKTIFLFRKKEAAVASKKHILFAHEFRSGIAEGIPSVAYNKISKNIIIGKRVVIHLAPRRKKGKFTVGYFNKDNSKFITHGSFDDIGNAKIAAVAIYETIAALNV